LKSQVGGDEGKFHYLNMMGSLTDAHIKRVTSGQESATLKAGYVRRGEEAGAYTRPLLSST
jgi:hypothetical protein